MPFTIPPSNKVAGVSTGLTTDLDALYAATLSIAGINVLNSAYAGGADPTGVADSTAAIQAAITAVPAAGGTVLIPPGTYKITGTGLSVARSGVSIAGAGKWLTFLNYTGTGDCIRVVDTSLISTRTVYGGAITGITIDGTSAGAASSGLHLGDMFQFQLDIGVQNFTGAGSIGVHLDNQNYWCEQLLGSIYASTCATGVVFDCSGATTSTGSYTRNDLRLFIITNNVLYQGVTFQNGAFLTDGRLSIRGNFASSGSVSTTASVLAFTTSSPGGHQASTPSINNSVLDIGCEAITAAHMPQTINFSGSGAIRQCTGVIDFGASTGTFVPSNNAGQFFFQGFINGDVNLACTPAYGTFIQNVTANAQTIFTTLGAVIKITGTGAFTGLILGAGVYDGQIMRLVNTTVGSLTFNATPATSHIADAATTPVVATLTARDYVWNATTSLWYRSA